MLGCPNCGQTLPFGQQPLTDGERRRLPLGNQHTKWNVIRWRAVKGAATYYGVTDWAATADPSVGYEENLQLMAEAGTDPMKPGGETMRELSGTDSGVER